VPVLREIANAVRGRIRALVHRRRLERDLRDELAFHLAKRAEKLRGEGFDAGTAAAGAERRFGNVMRMREACRSVWALEPVERFAQDLRYGARMLRRSASFTATVVATLALGVGATTAIVAVVELRPLPLPRPEELVLLHWNRQAHSGSWDAASGMEGCESLRPGIDDDCMVPHPIYRRLDERVRSLVGIAVFSNPMDVQVRRGDEVELAPVRFTSGNYFSVLGARPSLGRALSSSDDLPGAEPVAVLSHRFWTERFGADEGTVGRAIVLNGTSVTVVGVAAPGFFGLDATKVPAMWIPVHAAEQLGGASPMDLLKRLLGPKSGLLAAVGRLRPGVSAPAAEAELPEVLRQILIDEPDTAVRAQDAPRIALETVPHGVNSLRSSYGRALRLLRGLVALVLVVACANIANLLLARAAVRRREMGVRIALGAGRARIVRQLLTEGLLLSAIGTATGVLLGLVGSRVLAALLVPGLEPSAFAWSRPGASVFAFAAAVCAGTTVLFGLVPSWATRRLTPASELHVGGAGTKGALGATVGRWIVAGEVAVALVLLVGAGLLARTVVAYGAFDPGFRTDHLLTVKTAVARGIERPTDRAPEAHAILSRLSALPGVVAATWANQPLLGMQKNQTVAFLGPMEKNQYIQVDYLDVGPGFFATTGMSLMAGRDVEERDVHPDARRAWINQTLASRLPPGDSRVGAPLGFAMGCMECTIAGIVADARNCDVRLDINPTVYMPGATEAHSFLLRTAVPPMTLSEAARRAVKGVAPGRLVHEVRDEASYLAAATRSERLLAGISIALGALVLALAAVGIYGVLSYSVARRTSELAVRMALGAARGDVLRLVLREGLGVVGAGALLGVLLAGWSARFLKAFLFQVQPLDPVAFGGAVALLLAVAGLAAYRPAARATGVDPLVALRSE
jgi:predicted permease